MAKKIYIEFKNSIKQISNFLDFKANFGLMTNRIGPVAQLVRAHRS